MAARQGNGDEPITQINVTPLVDIMLVLLIIFMVTAEFISTPVIKVDLPQAAANDGPAPSDFSLTLTAAGEMFVNGEPVDEGGFLKRLDELVRASAAGPRLLIHADRAVTHGEVIRVIGLARKHGVERFAIDVSAPEE